MNASVASEIAAAAARLVVEDGLEYTVAKHKAARSLGRRHLRAADLPRNEVVEAEVRAYLAVFCADTQPGELRALRALAASWMQRLVAFRPHLSGAVWRGTATRRSAILIDLYCDDPKSAEIELINLGIDYEAGGECSSDGDGLSVLTVGARCSAFDDLVTIHLIVRDHDELRGALRPDPQGRSWRGDLASVQRLLHEEAGS